MAFTGLDKNKHTNIQIFTLLSVNALKICVLDTMEPLYKDPWDHENYLVISGFSLYQGKKTKKYKGLGLAKLPCYKRFL